MNQITIDCALAESPRALHRALAEQLSFPAWYGHNLDALYDCLTSISEETRLTLINFDGLGRYARGFRRVLEDAQSSNPKLEITII